MKNLIFPLLLLCSAFQFSGCFPSVGRMNARLENGFDFAAGAGYAFTTSGEGNGSRVNKTRHFPNGEIDLQFAKQATADEWGTAIQLKATGSFLYSVLDFYAQAPSSGPHVFGLGIEGGILSAFYLVYTYDFSPQAYVTLTPRLHYHSPDLNGDTVDSSGRSTKDNLSKIWITPQVAFGFKSPNGGMDLGFYFNWTRILGRGGDFEVDLCMEGNCSKTEDLRNNFFQSGVMARF